MLSTAGGAREPPAVLRLRTTEPGGGEMPQGPGRTVRFIWFDQDDTLYDYHRAMRRSIAVALSLIHDRHPRTRDTLDGDMLIQARSDVSDRCDRAGMDFVEARREAFRETLARYAEPNPGLADALTAAYYDSLQMDIRPFPDTEPCLRELRRAHTLGVLSNGMALVEGLGIKGYFRHLLYTDDLGLCKPQPEIFRVAESVAGAEPGQCLLVGDNEVADVVGARQAGWHAVWLNRNGHEWDENLGPPPHVIRSLSELPGLVHELGGR